MIRGGATATESGPDVAARRSGVPPRRAAVGTASGASARDVAGPALGGVGVVAVAETQVGGGNGLPVTRRPRLLRGTVDDRLGLLPISRARVPIGDLEQVAHPARTGKVAVELRAARLTGTLRGGRGAAGERGGGNAREQEAISHGGSTVSHLHVRVEPVAQGVAHEIDRERRDEDGEAGEGGDPPRVEHVHASFA